MEPCRDLDPRWDLAIDLLLEGVPKTRIAATCAVHRNTVRAWIRHPAFVRELQRRLDDHDVEVRLRRAHQTSAYADRVRRLAETALTEAERRPLDRAAQRVVIYWLRQYRRLVAMEREVIG